MPHALLPALFLLVAGATAPGTTPGPRPMPLTLFTFDRATEPDWVVVNDGVMGGRSSGFVQVAGGVLRFSGTLVTQGGGFTSLRVPCAVDLTGQLGIELRVRGNGRPFELDLSDGVRAYGRSVSRRAEFATSDQWTVVRLPFSTLRSSFRGRAVNAPPIELAQIQSLGLYILDGQDGPFWLEVDYIRAYGVGE
jgi:NADH dehydrogenase [ubiquinone] 1 alpha subcomplex assembly factor 1